MRFDRPLSVVRSRPTNDVRYTRAFISAELSRASRQRRGRPPRSAQEHRRSRRASGLAGARARQPAPPPRSRCPLLGEFRTDLIQGTPHRAAAFDLERVVSLVGAVGKDHRRVPQKRDRPALSWPDALLRGAGIGPLVVFADDVLYRPTPGRFDLGRRTPSATVSPSGSMRRRIGRSESSSGHRWPRARDDRRERDEPRRARQAPRALCTEVRWCRPRLRAARG